MTIYPIKYFLKGKLVYEYHGGNVPSALEYDRIENPNTPKEKPDWWRCDSCGNAVPFSELKCPNCGGALPPRYDGA
jgi:rubrerythrin